MESKFDARARDIRSIFSRAEQTIHRNLTYNAAVAEVKTSSTTAAAKCSLLSSFWV